MHCPAGRAALATLLFLTCPVPAAGQSADGVGTRAAGMSGAFVAVADDASAVYWNPGALATGPFFSLVVDRVGGRTGLEDPSSGSRSGFLIALAAPALGLTYYRLRTTTIVSPQPSAARQLGAFAVGSGQVRLDSLVTHHVGATIVQSVTDRIAVGATLKLVRGAAAIADVRDRDRKGLLADGVDLPGRSTTRLDADLGIVASAGPLRAGLAVRNVREPTFQTGSGALTLERQVRGGLALMIAQGWTVAADLDLTKTGGPFGPVRDAAFGTEARLARRAVVRGGVRVNTTGGALPGRAPSASAGVSYAIRAGVFLDAQITAGSARAVRGWGVAARFVY